MAPLFPPTTRTVTAGFTRNGIASDPDEVVAEFGLRGGTSTRLVYGVDTELNRAGTGDYSFDVDCLTPGRWVAKLTGRWDDAGGPTYRALEESWVVERSSFSSTLEG